MPDLLAEEWNTQPLIDRKHHGTGKVVPDFSCRQRSHAFPLQSQCRPQTAKSFIDTEITKNPCALLPTVNPELAWKRTRYSNHVACFVIGRHQGTGFAKWIVQIQPVKAPGIGVNGQILLTELNEFF